MTIGHIHYYNTTEHVVRASQRDPGTGKADVAIIWRCCCGDAQCQLTSIGKRRMWMGDSFEEVTGYTFEAANGRVSP